MYIPVTWELLSTVWHVEEDDHEIQTSAGTEVDILYTATGNEDNVQDSTAYCSET